MKFTSAIVTLSLVLFVSGEPPVPQNSYLPPQSGGLGNTYLPPSTSYGAPSTNSFRQSARPSSQYGAPARSQSAPSQQYGAPAQQYSAPSQQYGAPSAPSQQYGAPSAPSQQYGAPSAPSQQYGAPSAPSQQYGVPSSGPSAQYGAPAVTRAIFKSQQYSQQQNQGYSYGNGNGNGNGYSNGGYESNEPAKYNFEYAVLDYPSGNDFGHMESRDGDKTVGRYYVLLPDGRKQVVNYEADENGYRPQISYEQTNNGYANNQQNGGGDKFNGY